MKQAKATAAATVTQPTVTPAAAVTQPAVSSPTVAQQQSTTANAIDTGYDSELAALRQQIGRWFVLLASGTTSAAGTDRFASDSYNSDSFAAAAGASLTLQACACLNTCHKQSLRLQECATVAAWQTAHTLHLSSSYYYHNTV
jgi:hypothetical protein